MWMKAKSRPATRKRRGAFAPITPPQIINLQGLDVDHTRLHFGGTATTTTTTTRTNEVCRGPGGGPRGPRGPGRRRCRSRVIAPPREKVVTALAAATDRAQVLRQPARALEPRLSSEWACGKAGGGLLRWWRGKTSRNAIREVPTAFGYERSVGSVGYFCLVLTFQKNTRIIGQKKRKKHRTNYCSKTGAKFTSKHQF